MTGLDRLFAPRGILIAGASRSPGKLGTAMTESLASSPAPVALVNPRGGDGFHPDVASAVADLRARGGYPDLLVSCVPAGATAKVVHEAAQAGVATMLVCAGGFAEVGGDGIRLQDDLREASLGRLRVLGPNTSGFFVPDRRVLASFVPGVAALHPGSAAVVASSGGVNHMLSFRLADAGVGVSLGVGIGAGVDITHADVLRYLTTHEPTTAVALHIESIDDGPALLAAVRELVAHKPVVALVVGRRVESAFARSHTGALATSWRTTRSALAQAGAVVVDHDDQLVAAISALLRTRLSPATDPGVALITGQAGPGLMVVDHAEAAGWTMPELAVSTQQRIAELLPPMTFQANPVDTGRPGETFSEIVRVVADDSHIDLVAVYALTEPVLDLPGATADAGIEVPVVLGMDGPSESVAIARTDAAALGLPLVSGAASLSWAIGALVADARARAASAENDPTPDIVIDPRGLWDEARSKDLLEALGVSIPDRRIVEASDAARAALAELGGPVAVKILDAAVLHKTEIGGVHLGILTLEQVDGAVTALRGIGATRFLIERMASQGVDLVVSVRRDPVFGPIAMVGLGGTAAEAMADVAIRTIPVARAVVESMIGELRARELLHGWRGGPHLHVDHLLDILSAMGAVLTGTPAVSEIEINPLRLTDEGLIAIDAVVITEEVEDV